MQLNTRGDKMILENVKQRIVELELDGILLTGLENPVAAKNLKYVTGYTGSFGFAIITKDTQYLLGLYESNEFQQVINNYKDLRALKDKLKKWAYAIYKIENMSETFKKVYVDKIAQQQSRLATATEQIKQQITKMAIVELKDRKNRLNTYIKQAQFSTAQIYDKGRSSSSGGR